MYDALCRWGINQQSTSNPLCPSACVVRFTCSTGVLTNTYRCCSIKKTFSTGSVVINPAGPEVSSSTSVINLISLLFSSLLMSLTSSNFSMFLAFLSWPGLKVKMWPSNIPWNSPIKKFPFYIIRKFFPCPLLKL